MFNAARRPFTPPFNFNKIESSIKINNKNNNRYNESNNIEGWKTSCDNNNEFYDSLAENNLNSPRFGNIDDLPTDDDIINMKNTNKSHKDDEHLEVIYDPILDC